MRRISLIAGVVVIVMVLTGCGGTNARTGDVEVFSWWTEGSEKAALQGLVDEFDARYPEYTFVNATVAGGGGGNARDVLASRLESGHPPSSFQTHAGGELVDYIRQGRLTDLTWLYQREGWNAVFPDGVVELLTYRGGIYSVPANVHRANVVWANPEVLSQAGVTGKPESIRAWIADMRKLRAAGIRAPLALATEWTQVHLLETVLIADLGPDGYRGLWDGSTDWSSGEVTRALKDYRTLLGFSNPDRSTLDWVDAVRYVTEGRAAYTVTGDWAAGSLSAQGLMQERDWTWFPVPGTEGVFDFVADSFTLPRGAPNREGATAWLTVVGSAAGQQAFNGRKGSIPVRTDVAPPPGDGYARAAFRAFQRDTIVPSLAHGTAVSSGWLAEISAAVGDFGNSRDVPRLQAALADAARTHLR